MNAIVLTAEEEDLLREGIGLILSKWTAMRAAVDNGWGGRDSREKAERTVSTLVDFFIQSKVYPPDFDRIGDILERGLTELNTVAEDDSIPDVTETLLDLYDECLKGNHQFFEQLRLPSSHNTATVVKVSNGNHEDEESDGEDEDACMNNNDQTMVDASHHCSNQMPEAMPVDEPEADDGWTLVPSRKNKGKTN